MDFSENRKTNKPSVTSFHPVYHKSFLIQNNKNKTFGSGVDDNTAKAINCPLPIELDATL